MIMIAKWVSDMKRGFPEKFNKIFNGEGKPPNFYGKAPNIKKKALLALDKKSMHQDQE
jgi:hypothetical protein